MTKNNPPKSPHETDKILAGHRGFHYKNHHTMTKQTTRSQHQSEAASHPHDARAEKRAEALRQNLARRKGQSRDRADLMAEQNNDKTEKDQ